MTTTVDPTAPSPATPTLDEGALMAFVGEAVTDVGRLLGGSMVVLGDRLGLYRALGGAGPLTPAELADRTGTVERYVREWLSAQAATGYVTYEGDGRFSLSPEHAIVLTDESSPACVIGAFETALAAVHSTDRLTEAFRTGHGVGWGEHHHDLFEGCERFFRPGYAANLVSTWLPALAGVAAKLEAGATVADVGCGHGASTLLMAEAYPASTFVGFDAHDASITAARAHAAEAGLTDRVTFEVAHRPARRRLVRPRLLLRLPARHGRPRRRAARHPGRPGPRRHADGRRADGRRPGGGQPQPRGRGVLRVLHPAVHAELPVAGGGGGPRRPGR